MKQGLSPQALRTLEKGVLACYYDALDRHGMNCGDRRRCEAAFIAEMQEVLR